MTQELKSQPAGWGVLLHGDPFDLEDCKDSLKLPFDPWVVVGIEGLVLRSENFDTATSAQEVHERSKLVVTWLNGALSLNSDGGPITSGGIIQFKADGTERRTTFAEARGMVEARDRVRGFATVLGPDGKPLPPPPPQPSNIQKWMDITEKDDLLSDAIVYYSRANDWFDMYKCLECLIMRFGDSEDHFKKLGWASATKVKLLKQTANHERHARKKFDPPDDPMPKSEAKELLGVLLRRGLEEASTEANS